MSGGASSGEGRPAARAGVAGRLAAPARAGVCEAATGHGPAPAYAWGGRRVRGGG